MAKVYKSICAEIDTLSCHIIHLSEKLIAYKLKVEMTMNHGFFNLAKARYIMGSKCVSTLQLPTENSNPIRAISTVCRAEHSGHWVYKIHRRKEWQRASNDKVDVDNTKPEVVKDVLASDGEGLRKRKDAVLVEDSNYQELKDSLADGISTPDSDSETNYGVDPIRMFGLLVPQTLKVAQQSFVDTLDVVTKCATIQSEIDNNLKRYHHLKRVKRLIEEATDKNINLLEDVSYWTPSYTSTKSMTSQFEISDDFGPEESYSNISIPRYEHGAEEDYDETPYESSSDLKSEVEIVRSDKSVENVKSKNEDKESNLEVLVPESLKISSSTTSLKEKEVPSSP